MRWVILSAIVLVTAGWDISQRFWLDIESDPSLDTDQSLAANMPTRLDNQRQQALLERYQAHFPEQDNTDNQQAQNQPGMSLEQQRQQRGELGQLFAGDNVVRLVAIIKQPKAEQAQSPFAVLSINNTKEEDSSQLQRLTQGESLLGYTLTRLTQTQAVLAAVPDLERKVSLRLYQPKLASTATTQ